MFKFIFTLAIGGLFGCLIGSGRFKEYIPKVSIGFSNTIYSNKEHQFELGKTKSGEPCRIARKWTATGLYETEESLSTTAQFVTRNLVNDGQTDKYGIKHDCFLDVDTQEYKLEDYTKAETMAGFSEKYVFLNRDKDAFCIRFQYDRYCKYKDSRSQLACGSTGYCIPKERNIIIMLIFAMSILIIPVSVILILYK